MPRRADPAAEARATDGTGRRPKSRASRWWLAATVLTAVAAGISLLTPVGRHQWALSLFRQPTPYTVLSFTKPTALPATAVRNRPLRFSFTVGNHEGRAEDYRYVLSASSGRGSRVLGISARTVTAGAAWTVSAAVRPACRASPCRIQVSLPGHRETIDFLVSLAGPERGGPEHGHRPRLAPPRPGT